MKPLFTVTKEIYYKAIGREQRMTLINRVALMRKPLATLAALSKQEIRLGLQPAADILRSYRQELKRETAYQYTVTRRLNGRTFEAHYMAKLGDDNGRGDAIHYLKESIRAWRRRIKSNDDTLINRSPNWVLKRFQQNLLKTNKQPKDAETYVGIEIECIMPDDADMRELLPFGKYISVVGDGSIEPDDGEEGREIRVLVKREEVRDVIPPLIAKLVELGGRVNRSCGLHVHLDQRQTKEPEKAFHKLVRALPLLWTVVPTSRRSNQYCKRNRHAQFNVAANGNRYRAINASAYYRHQTIEVRLFGGTLEANKIINWVETLHAITDGEMVNRCPKNFDTARNYWKLSDENATWLKERQGRYGRDLAANVEADTDVVSVAYDEARELEQQEAA